jgi:ATP-dependent 26S proteasome regulatory subunit
LEFNKYEWVSSVTFENRFFTNKDKIINNIKFFLENELWYKQRGIPYTLGFLLYGNPGCGKTGFIKALMNLTNFNAISIKLNSHFNFLKLKDIIYKKELNNDIIIPLHKRIFIFEDIDCMTDIIIDRDKEKENKKNKNNNINNNNLSYLLNILDGIHETPGRIIIMTTNKPEVLDKALTRPGRIDHVIHFKNATTEDIKNMINFYWNNTKEEIKINEELNFKYTHAEVINICRKSSDINETIFKLSSLHSL